MSSTKLKDVQISGKTLFLGVGEMVSGKRLAFELIDQEKKMALTNVNGYHLVY